jgi:dihydrofolate synthase/folylpolyglutamate synthase
VESVILKLPIEATYFYTKANIPRAMNEETLMELGKKYGLSGNCYGSVEEAYNTAKAIANDEDMIFVGGSTFVVAEVL